MPDYDWWRTYGPKVKSWLTKGEKDLASDPSHSVSLAYQALAQMEAHGYPDWWHRAERLRLDAELAVQRERWPYY